MFNRIFNSESGKITSATMAGITEIGKDCVQHQLARGITFEILATLNEHSPRSIKELANEIDEPVSDVKVRIKTLERQGYVTFAGVR